MLLLVVGVLLFCGISANIIYTTNDIDHFYTMYLFLNGTKVISFDDINCYSSKIKKINNYLLLSRENYLDFLNVYTVYSVYGSSIDNFNEGMTNYLNSGKLYKYMDETQKNYLLFSKYLSELTMEYGRLIDEDYSLLKRIGADNENFPGILRKYFIEYDKFNSYFVNNTKKKELIKPFRNFVYSIEYQSRTKEPLYRKLAYDLLYNSIKDLCYKHLEINRIIKDYKKEIEIEKQKIYDRYSHLRNKYNKIKKFCPLFLEEYNSDNIISIKKGSINSTYSLCINIENILNSFSFRYFNDNDEDYIYLNYLKLKDQNKKLDQLDRLITQVGNSIYNMNKSCFDDLNKLRRDEVDPYLREMLNKKVKNYFQCVQLIENYKYLKNKKECNFKSLDNLKSKIYVLDNIGYDVSTEISLLNLCESNLDNTICCYLLPRKVSEKYSFFLDKLNKLKNKVNEIISYLNRIGDFSFTLKNYDNDLKEYSYLMDILPDLEKEYNQKVISYLKENTKVTYSFKEIPKCNKNSYFTVNILVYNPFDFKLNVNYTISDIYGVYQIKSPLSPGENVYSYRVSGFVSVCNYSINSIVGDLNTTKINYLINVSSISDKSLFCLNDGIFTDSNTNCIILMNGENIATLVKKTRIDLNMTNKLIVLNFGNLKYDIFILNYKNISKILFNVSGIYYLNISKNEINNTNFSLNYSDNHTNYTIDFYYKYYELNNSYQEYLNKFRKEIYDKINDLINLTNDKKELEELYNKKQRINVSNLTNLVKISEDLNKKINFSFWFNKEKYLKKIYFICSFNFTKCKYLISLLDNVSNNKSLLEFKKKLSSSYYQVKNRIKEEVSFLNTPENLVKLRLSIGNDTVYKNFEKDYYQLKQSLFDHLDKGDPNYKNYYNRLKNLNSEIESIIDSQKEKAKFLIFRIKEILKNSNNLDKYSGEINKIVNYYKSGEYKKVIDLCNQILKSFDLYGKKEEFSFYEIISFIIVVILIGISIYYISNNNQNKNKKVVLKKLD